MAIGSADLGSLDPDRGTMSGQSERVLVVGEADDSVGDLGSAAGRRSRCPVSQPMATGARELVAPDISDAAPRSCAGLAARTHRGRRSPAETLSEAWARTAEDRRRRPTQNNTNQYRGDRSALISGTTNRPRLLDSLLDGILECLLQAKYPDETSRPFSCCPLHRALRWRKLRQCKEMYTGLGHGPALGQRVGCSPLRRICIRWKWKSHTSAIYRIPHGLSMSVESGYTSLHLQRTCSWTLTLTLHRRRNLHSVTCTFLQKVLAGTSPPMHAGSRR